MEYFNSLPEEITLDIISRVPAESVLECKSVCTNWRSLIRHPSFSKKHFHHLNHPASDLGKLGFIALTSFYEEGKNHIFQYFEYDENHESIERIRRVNLNPLFGWFTIFLGSCNGLICLARDGFLTEKTFICNPITREYVILPEIKSVGMDDGMSGFGYVASTNEYKVVRIILENKSWVKQVDVYTLGSGNGWRNLGEFNFGIRGNWRKGIFASGVLYWMDDQSEMILPFDLAEEKFCEHLSFPYSLGFDDEGYYQLGVLDGCLSFGINLSVDGAECWDVWLLNKRNDNRGRGVPEERQSLGWSEVFRVYDRELFAITKYNTVLTFKHKHINIHDLEATTSKTIMDFKERFIRVFPHKNTLLSLKELGEEDVKIMESVEIEVTESHDQHFNQL